MSDVSRFKDAEQRWASGDIRGAIPIYLDLCVNGRDDRTRLQSALLLTNQLKPIDHLTEILQVCDIGIECARKLQDSLPEAHLMGRRAESLEFLRGLHSRRAVGTARGPVGARARRSRV